METLSIEQLKKGTKNSQEPMVNKNGINEVNISKDELVKSSDIQYEISKDDIQPSYADNICERLSTSLTEREEIVESNIKEFIKEKEELNEKENLKKYLNESTTDDTKNNISNDEYYDDDVSEEDNGYINDFDEDDIDTSDEELIIKQAIVKSLNKNKKSKGLDLSKFTVLEKPKNVYKSIEDVANLNTNNCVDGYLFNSGIGLTMSKFKAIELEMLNPAYSESNSTNMNLNIFKAIYKHCQMANKPSFEIWMKSIKSTDLNSLMGLVYKATFPDKNPIIMSCNDKKCKKTFVKDYEFKDLINFKSKEIEEQYYKGLENHTQDWNVNNVNVEYQICQISENYAVKIKQPSLFETEIELFYGNDKFREEYSKTISYVLFIDEIYEIDKEQNTLRPLSYVKDKKNDKLTYTSKVKAYSKFINSLDSSSFVEFDKLIGEDTSLDNITFEYPESVCPNCGQTIPKSIIDMKNLVFYRHRMEGTTIS